MDRIALRGIRASGRHGANPGEREREQPFTIDLEIEIDLHVPERSDALSDTVNYAELHARIVSIVESTSFELLERLAGEMLRAVFADPRVRAAQLTLAKPDLLAGATPSVTLRRENARFRNAFP
ncbi:MAG: dihydroneopterin aldolase [Candidatus Eremiobacteraeota bacterium]|nr:dihydroneopterin aldolase [Candidatus Eremiobacteraeota bacterium]